MVRKTGQARRARNRLPLRRLERLVTRTRRRGHEPLMPFIDQFAVCVEQESVRIAAFGSLSPKGTDKQLRRRSM
jgi:hypothetical protein